MADVDNLTCSTKKTSWVYILIGCVCGAIALIAIIVVIVFIVKSGVCNKAKYQKIQSGLITYG